MKKECAYCSLPEIKAREILHNDLAWAFLTNIPITPGHTLVAPIRCAAKMEDLTKEEWLAIMELASCMTRALRERYGSEGFNFAWNQGKLAGQSVPHFHLHIIPRKEGDAGLLGYDPRSFVYRTGDREPTGESELQAITQSIKKFI